MEDAVRAQLTSAGVIEVDTVPFAETKGFEHTSLTFELQAGRTLLFAPIATKDPGLFHTPRQLLLLALKQLMR